MQTAASIIPEVFFWFNGFCVGWLCRLLVQRHLGRNMASTTYRK